MLIIIQFIELILLLFGIILMFFNPRKAIPILVLALIFEYGLPFSQYIFLVKLLLFVTCIIVIIKYGYKITFGKSVFILIVFLLLNIITGFLYNFNISYNFYDLVTSFATIVLGILLFHINWDDKTAKFSLFLLTIAPIFGVILGVMYKESFFDLKGRIVSIGQVPHLPFWCGVSIGAAYILSKVYGKKSFNFIILLNFVIVLLTNQRGGTIFSLIMILPFIFDYIKTLNKEKLVKISIIIPLISPFVLNAITILYERTFSEGELNTTNRFFAWDIILQESESNRLLGLGIGSLKTTTNYALIRHGYSAAHNEYVRFIYESGVIGLLIMLFILIYIFRKAMFNFVVNNKYYLFFIFGFALYSFTDNTISAVQFWAPFMLFLSNSIKSNKDNQKNNTHK
jgi:teichuronic acid biosynthesis protein TuaE